MHVILGDLEENAHEAEQMYWGYSKLIMYHVSIKLRKYFQVVDKIS